MADSRVRLRRQREYRRHMITSDFTRKQEAWVRNVDEAQDVRYLVFAEFFESNSPKS